MRSFRLGVGCVGVFLASMLLVGCATTPSGSADNEGLPIALVHVATAIEAEMDGVATQLPALATFYNDHAGEVASLVTYADQLFGDGPVSVYVVTDDGTESLLHDSGRFGAERPPLAIAGAKAGGVTFTPAVTAPEGVVIDGCISVNGGVLVARVLASELVARAVDAQLSGTHIDVWVMETKGLLVYDADPEEIGRNLLEDPFYDAYPELQALTKQMTRKKQGSGVYTFLSTGFDNLVDKQATWTTAEFSGHAWRVVVAELVSGKTGEVLGLPQDLDVMWDVRAVKTMISTPAWQTAFATADEKTLRQEFALVLQEHDLIYSMACIFPDGVIRFGEPPQNSFDGYDLRAGRIDRDAVLYGAGRSIADSWHVFELVEGGRGLFYVLPVFIDGRQSGAVYAIWLLPEKA